MSGTRRRDVNRSVGLRASMVQRLMPSGHRRGVAVIIGGTALGQALIALSSPVLSRIYAPSAFGLLATFTAIVSLGSIVSAARLEMAVPIVRTDSDAREVVRAGLGLCLISSLIGTVLCIPLAGPVSRLVAVPDLRWWLWLAPWACGAAAAFVVLNQWAVRVRAFGAIGRRNTLRAAFTVGVQVVCGASAIRPGGTVVGLTVGHAAGAVSMLRKSPFKLRDFVRGIGDVRGVLREWKGFCLKLTLSGLFNVAGTQVPVLLFSSAYSQTAVGWLGLTQRTLALPVGLVGTAVAQVYVSALAASVRDGREVRALFTRVSKRLALLALPACVLVAATGPQLFSFVFGQNWEEAGNYARILIFGIAAQFVSVPLSQTAILVGRTTLQVMWDIGRFVVVCGAVWTSVALGRTAFQTIVVLGIATFVCYIAQWIMSWRIVQQGPPTDSAGPIRT